MKDCPSNSARHRVARPPVCPPDCVPLAPAPAPPKTRPPASFAVLYAEGCCDDLEFEGTGIVWLVGRVAKFS